MVTAQTAPSNAILYDQHLRLLASHYSNMDRGRADSAAYVTQYFHSLVDLVSPDLFVEAGAYRADASREIKARHPDCRVIAFEANPYNHAEYRDALGFAEAGIDYLNLALTDEPGPVTFHLRARQDGQELRKVTGNSSLLRRTDASTEYEEVTVEGVTLDGHLAREEFTSAALWIDVEGATRLVLQGATRTLERAKLVLIEVEETGMWEDQWRSLDVLEFFLAAGFVPVTRDIEYDHQYNLLFVSSELYRRSEFQHSHELHLNFLAQHMGLKPSS